MTSGDLQRVHYIDTAKGIAILLVVLGHILEQCPFDQYIYSFHMPLFFLLSGITFHRRDEENFKRFFLRKFRSLLVPYYCFGFVAIMIFFIASHFTNNAITKSLSFSFFEMCANLMYGSSLENRLKFYEPLWFLTTLFSIQTIAFPLLKTDRYTRTLKCMSQTAFFSILFAATAVLLNALQTVLSSDPDPIRISTNIIPVLPLGINMAIREFPFFIIGFSFRSRFLRLSADTKLTFTAALCLMLLGFLGFSSAQHLKYSSLLSGCGGLFLFYFNGVVSSLSCLFFCSLIQKQNIFSLFGRNTLSILVIHKYPILFVMFFWKRGSELIEANDICFCIPFAVAVAFVCVLAGRFLMRYFPFLYGRSCYFSCMKQYKKFFHRSQ